VRLIDFMPPRIRTPELIRIVEGLEGTVAMTVLLSNFPATSCELCKVHGRCPGACAVRAGLVTDTPQETRTD